MWDRLKRWRWAMLIALLLAAGLGFAFWPSALPVDLAEVTRGPMAVGVTDDGVTRADELYVVSAPITGYLSRIELKPGDEIAAGQLITRVASRLSAPLDPRSQQDLRGALAVAQAAAVGSEAALGQATRDLARAEELAQRGFLPRAQLEASRTRVSTNQALVQQSHAEVARIRSLLDQPQGSGSGAPVPVRAPAGGLVLSVLRESEGIVAEGTEIMTIGNPQSIEVVVDLLSREAVRVRPGNRVEITQWGGRDPLIGRVNRVEPFGRLKVSALGIEEQRVNVIIGFAGEAAAEAARLGHGYQLDATIILWQSDNVLRVPIGSLFRGGDGGWRVFLNRAGRVRNMPLELGHLNDEFAEVIAGLEQGDEVVLNPANSLRAGDRIRRR
jgi:HlyD family secretion protein